MIFFLPNGIGDILMAVPALRRLVAVRGVEGVTVVVASPVQGHILRAFVDPRLRTFARHDGGRFSELRLFLRMLASGARVIGAPMAATSRVTWWFMLLMARPVYLPSAFLPRSIFGLRRTPFLLKDFDGHQVDFFVRFLAAIEPRLDARPVDPSEMAPAGMAAPAARAATGRRRVVVGISCGPAERHKIPSPAAFANLVQAVARRVDVEVLMIGSPSDRALIDEFRRALDPAVPIEEAVGLPIDALVARIAACDLGISGTTGQGHMMAAAQIPMLVLAGVTSPQESGPFVRRAAVLRHRLACGPCYQAEFRSGCGELACMETLDVEEGASLAQRLLAEEGFGAGWRTREPKIHAVPVHVIKAIHAQPRSAWTIPQEN
jgi:hypothetical protein